MNPPGLFITGTDTGVGKTRIAVEILRALVAGGHRPGVVKPIASSGVADASGRMSCDDAEELARAVGAEVPVDSVCPIILPGDLAPSVAAALVGRTIDLDMVLGSFRESMRRLDPPAEIMVVEGVGGLLCPIAADATVADLAVALDYPLVIVARRGLGTLNHTLLTVEAARSRGLRVAGVVLNGSGPTANALAEETNPRELASRLGCVPILAEFGHDPTGPSRRSGDHAVDWWGLAKPPRMAPSPPA